MSTKNLVTTYYAHATKGRHKVKIKVTRGSNRDEIVPNIARMMTSGRASKDGLYAYVAETIDEETMELLCVAKYDMGNKFHVLFESDVTRPICVMDIPED